MLPVCTSFPVVGHRKHFLQKSIPYRYHLGAEVSSPSYILLTVMTGYRVHRPCQSSTLLGAGHLCFRNQNPSTPQFAAIEIMNGIKGSVQGIDSGVQHDGKCTIAYYAIIAVFL